MKANALRGLVGALLALGLWAGPAQAQLLQPVVQGRWVILNGDATVQGRDGATAGDSAFHYQPLLPETNFAPFDVTDHLVLDVAAPDGTAAVHLDGTMSQQSSFGASSFAYDGRVVVSATATGTPGPLTQAFVGGPGFHSDFLGIFFDVTSPVTVVLSLHADIAGSGSFAFRLAGTEGPNLVFESVGDRSSIPAHELTLQLAPGRYDLTADLNGFARLGEAGTVTAGFTFNVSPIPEPQTWLLILAGLPLLAMLRGRLRR